MTGHRSELAPKVSCVFFFKMGLQETQQSIQIRISPCFEDVSKCETRKHCSDNPIHYLILIIPGCLSFIYLVHKGHIRELFFLTSLPNTTLYPKFRPTLYFPLLLHQNLHHHPCTHLMLVYQVVWYQALA